MLKRICLLFALFLAACTSLPETPYEEALLALEVRVTYPEAYADYCREGVEVAIEEVSSAGRYTAPTDADGCARFRVTRGIYRVAVSDNTGEAIFNGMTDRVRLTDGDLALTLPLSYSRPGNILIKEIYCGGCSRAPLEGTYQADRYVILHNNSSETHYLDGLCLGTLEPYNSNSSSGNVWTSTDPDTGATLFREYAPIVEAVWRFPGDGERFPLAPGEDAVVAINGAVDHTLQYPLSVDLNREEYFVCYNPTLYPNTTYHPVPGDKIQPARYMEVAVKVGRSNSYILSLNSPTVVLFRAVDIGMDDYLADRTASTVTKPGSSEICVKIPWEWILDGVEVYSGSSSNNVKRLSDAVDAGFVYLSASFLGHTLHRRLDETATAAAGFEIYQDTNNSSNDFYEREVQSLHE